MLMASLRSKMNVGPNPSQPTTTSPQSHDTSINTKGLLLLSAIHFSSAWGDRSINFGVYLLLATIFPSTLLPASIYGFSSTGCGILFSSSVGTAVDKYDRLSVLRIAIVAQKISSAAVCALCLLFFVTPLGGKHLRGRALVAFIGIVAFGAVEKVSTVCLNICIERDWASTIAGGSSVRLTRLNAWLRRIDLTCDLVSPIFISGISTGGGYAFAAAFLCAMAMISLVLEITASGFAYRAFPELESEQTSRFERRAAEEHSGTSSTSFFVRLLSHFSFRDTLRDSTEFYRLPVFYTCLSIASIYLTVLSFDGTMLTFLKNSRNYSDVFIAGQRAVCTFAGLAGTVLFPIISRKLGLARTGSWSIWSEFMCLVPVLIALYVGENSDTETRSSVPAWNSIFLFGGMACSRIFLWMFDLTQLQILQESLEDHPHRNRLMSFQYTLQNVFDMGKYALTMALSRPSQFRWAGLVSILSVFAGGLLYALGYARRVRGHIAPHPRWLSKFKLK